MVSVKFDDIEFTTAEIFDETTASTEKGLDAVASETIPRILRSNFYAKGQRGGNKEWKDVSPLSVESIQQTDPSYRQNPNLDEPLMNTGTLRDSAVTQAETLAREISLLDYGFPHDNGTAVLKTADGSFDISKREHMFIVEGEDTDKIDAAFEEAFNK